MRITSLKCKLLHYCNCKRFSWKLAYDFHSFLIISEHFLNFFFLRNMHKKRFFFEICTKKRMSQLRVFTTPSHVLFYVDFLTYRFSLGIILTSRSQKIGNKIDSVTKEVFCVYFELKDFEIIHWMRYVCFTYPTKFSSCKNLFRWLNCPWLMERWRVTIS